MQTATATDPFWETTRLEDMSPEQWERLCDGCGKCCLNKYEDEDTGAMHYTNVACRLLDHLSCRCTDYANRAALVADCISLAPEHLREPAWLPETCAYRRVAEGRPLPPWHHLRCGDPEAVHRAGASARGRVVCESKVQDPLWHLVDWVS
jgi:uncharacterized cysteine cluster protein YcgN (CxxCxxCC family)